MIRNFCVLRQIQRIHSTLYSCFVESGHSSSLQRKTNSASVFVIQKARCFRMQCGPGGCFAYSKEELKKRLTPEQYQITQEKDTERAFTGKYYRHEEKGTYKCVVCGQDLFSSETKYPSPCGWPAFFDVIDSSKVKYTQDLSHDMVRTEVSCSQCGAHLGHLFDDGPKPTGKRFCINSAALDFQKASETNDTTAA